MQIKTKMNRSACSASAPSSITGLKTSLLQWAFYGLGFLAMIVALLYFNNLARRALATYSQECGCVQGGKSSPEAGTGAAKDSS